MRMSASVVKDIAFAALLAACGAPSAPASPGTSLPAPAVADAGAAPTGSLAAAAPPEIARFVQDWQVACVGGPESAKTTNECQIETLSRLTDDAFFFAGGYYGSAHLGSHLLKHGAMRMAFLGVVDRAGTVKWVKTMGGSWQNEITESVAIDAHHVMIEGFHGNAFDPSLKTRVVRPVVLKGVAQNMGWKVKEAFVGVVSDEGKVEWLKDTLDIVGSPWDEDVGSPDCELESDGSGGAFCRLEWAHSIYRAHVDAKGASEILSITPIVAPVEPPRPVSPPGRALDPRVARTLSPTEVWRLVADREKLTQSSVPAIIANETNDVRYVLWHSGARGTWNAIVGDGPLRGDEGLFVAKDGVAWTTAPRVRAIPGHPLFSEVAIYRAEADGRLAWSTPLWGMALPAASTNRVDVRITGQSAAGDIELDAYYLSPIAIANVPLPPPSGLRGKNVHVAVDGTNGAIKRVEWIEAPSGCLRDLTISADHRIDLSATEWVVGGSADGVWDTATCGASHGWVSVLARFVRAPPAP